MSKTDGLAVALGSFDGLHSGHMEVIKKAVDSSYTSAVFAVDKPVSGRLMTDRLKAQRLTEAGVETVITKKLFQIRDMSPEQFVGQYLAHELNARFVSCGYNYRFGKNGAGSCETLAELCRQYSIECCICPEVLLEGKTISSTAIREYIGSGDIESANRMLGTPYTIDFAVVSGRRLGRLLGTPTINQLLPDDFVQPKRGVYASRVLINDRWLPAVTNFGVKPTVSSHEAPVYETWIMGFDGELYGQRICTSLLSFIRPEQKFDGLDELKEQILKDAAAAADIFQRQG